ncbi:hypothetical protein GTW71_28950 [Streptomyces sp. SID6041]|nr:hypothetical protein [Streptomyces sp. SID6041]
MRTVVMSPECRLAQVSGYEDMHRECRQTSDVPLPHGSGILLLRRCACSHHPYVDAARPRAAGQGVGRT